MHHRDEQQDKAFLQGLNPDQIQRREKAVPKNTYNDYVSKGYSGLSSESINRDLLLWSVRGKQVVGRNRQLYKGFI
jgi:hypothetical protein